jgi:hypothetical protein
LLISFLLPIEQITYVPRGKKVSGIKRKKPPTASDLPDGQIIRLAVQPRLKKYSASPLTQIKSINTHPVPKEGRYAIVTDVGRDAMDAAASGAQVARGRMALVADGEVVWS